MCSRHKGLVVAVLLAPSMVGPCAHAQSADDDDARGLWTLGVAVSTDDHSNRSLAVSLDAAVAAQTWVSAWVGDSHSPRSRADVSARTLAVGIDHRFGSVGLRGGTEHWGDPGSIESDDYDAAIYFATDRIRAEIGYEQRHIDITATLVGPNDRVFSRKVPLSADGRSLSLRIDATDRVGLRFGLKDYDYPPRLALLQLPRIDALNLLSLSTLTLANSFVSEIRSAGVDVDIRDKVLSFEASRDASAVDGSELTSFEAVLLLPVGRRFDLELHVGRSRSDLLAPSVYGGFTFLIYGGG